MVQIKATALLVAAAAIAPALAQGSYYDDSSLVTREDVVELANILAREYGFDMEIEARDFDDMEDLDLRDLAEVYERDPMFGMHHLSRFAHGVGRRLGFGRHNHAEGGEHHHHHDFQGHPGGFHHHHEGMGMGGPSDAASQPPPDPSLGAREFEEFDELYERDPMFGMHHLSRFAHGVGRHLGFGRHNHAEGGEHHHHQHEFEGHPGGFHHHHHEGMGMGGPPDAASQPPPDPSLGARELESDYDELLSRYFDDLYERELASENEYTELAARAPEGDDFEIELVQRSPNFIEWIKNLFHPHHKNDKKNKKDDKKDKKDEKKDDKKDDKKDTKDDSKDAKDSKTTTTTKTDDKEDLESREFDDFWYDLD